MKKNHIMRLLIIAAIVIVSGTIRVDEAIGNTDLIPDQSDQSNSVPIPPALLSIADSQSSANYKTNINPINLEKYVKELIKTPIRIDKTGVKNSGKYWEHAALAHYKINLGACDLHAWVHSSQSLCLEHHGDCQSQDCQKSELICEGSKSCRAGGGVLLKKGFDTLRINKFETYPDRISSVAYIARIESTANFEASTSSMNSCGLIRCKCWMEPGVCCIHPHACTEIYLRDIIIDLDIVNENDMCALRIKNVNFNLDVKTSGLYNFGPLFDKIVNGLFPRFKSRLVDELKNQIASNAKKYMCTLIGAESPDINMTKPYPVIPPGRLTNLKEMPFNVLSYNVMAFPYFIEFSGQNERLNAIVQKLVDLDRKYSLDIIGVNELWTGHDVMANASPFYIEFINQMKVNWPYVSDTTSGEEPLNSGLRIFSKWPIVKSKAITFSNCKDEDCLASKGALFVQVNKTMTKISKKFNLIITHPQAGNIPEIQEIRKKQFQSIKKFVADLLADKLVSTTEPLIFLGDMNMNHFDKENFPGEYEYLLSTLEAELPKITDEKGNDWQNSTYYQDNCPEPWANKKYQYPWTICNNLKNDLSPPDKNEWLDYVLYGVKFQKPIKSRVFTVIEMKQSLSVPWLPGKFAESLTDARKNMKSIKDLSDHHPLLGEMVFNVETR